MLSALLMAFAVTANVQTETRLVVEDPALLIDSSLTGILTAALGNQLDYKIQAFPQALAYVALSTTPPFGAGAINGVPVEIDLANFDFALEAAPVDANGQLIWSTFVPESLLPGTSLWTQAVALDPLTGKAHLSDGVRLDLVLADPANLPLLEPGQHAGISFAPPLPAAQVELDLAFVESLAHGADVSTLRIAWSDIEVSPGKYDASTLVAELQQAQAIGQRTLLVLETINGHQLELPSDLTDPSDPNQLAPGFTWDSYAITSRLEILLDLVAPLLESYGGFYLSVGNQVDLYLTAHPTELAAFAAFVEAGRTHVHATQSKLAVGTTLTAAGALGTTGIQAALLAASDNLAYTYFPLAADFSAAAPSVVGTDLPALAALVAPRPLLLQAVGYGSGAEPTPLAGATPAMQAAFVKALFEASLSVPKARVLVLANLADLTATELFEIALTNQNSNPNFLELHASVGLRYVADGTAKPSWSEFLLGLDSL